MHRIRVSLALLWQWRHNRLRNPLWHHPMTTRAIENYIFSSLNIYFIHSDIHGWSCGNLLMPPDTDYRPAQSPVSNGCCTLTGPTSEWQHRRWTNPQIVPVWDVLYKDWQKTCQSSVVVAGQSGCTLRINKIWWLCLVLTSSTSFASEVGYRTAKI